MKYVMVENIVFCIVPRNVHGRRWMLSASTIWYLYAFGKLLPLIKHREKKLIWGFSPSSATAYCVLRKYENWNYPRIILSSFVWSWFPRCALKSPISIIFTSYCCFLLIIISSAITTFLLIAAGFTNSAPQFLFCLSLFLIYIVFHFTSFFTSSSKKCKKKYCICYQISVEVDKAIILVANFYRRC